MLHALTPTVVTSVPVTTVSAVTESHARMLMSVPAMIAIFAKESASTRPVHTHAVAVLATS